MLFLLGAEFNDWHQDEDASPLSPTPIYYSSDGGPIIKSRKNPKKYRSGEKRRLKPQPNLLPDEESEASFTFLRETTNIDIPPFFEEVQEGTENISDDVESDYVRKHPQALLPNPLKHQETQYQSARDGHDLTVSEEIDPLLGRIPEQRCGKAIQKKCSTCTCI